MSNEILWSVLSDHIMSAFSLSSSIHAAKSRCHAKNFCRIQGWVLPCSMWSILWYKAYISVEEFPFVGPKVEAKICGWDTRIVVSIFQLVYSYETSRWPPHGAVDTRHLVLYTCRLYIGLAQYTPKGRILDTLSRMIKEIGVKGTVHEPRPRVRPWSVRTCSCISLPVPVDLWDVGIPSSTMVSTHSFLPLAITLLWYFTTCDALYTLVDNVSPRLLWPWSVTLYWLLDTSSILQTSLTTSTLSHKRIRLKASCNMSHKPLRRTLVSWIPTTIKYTSVSTLRHIIRQEAESLLALPATPHLVNLPNLHRNSTVLFVLDTHMSLFVMGTQISFSNPNVYRQLNVPLRFNVFLCTMSLFVIISLFIMDIQV